HVIAATEILGPALLKIDVQGYEQQVLEGCETLLSRFDWVFAELSFVELYAGQTLAPEVIGWLETRGFRLDGVYVSDMSYKNGRMIQGDFLFHRKTATEEA
ncbi:MAG: FkbM family methyltransferase, partial [Paracoccaceae bacterium]